MSGGAAFKLWNRRHAVAASLTHPAELTTLRDRDLITRFLAGDEASFAEIVARHTSLVMGVCRRILRHAADAEDAFQATFLVLARKAGTVNWHDSLANWLHTTARRTSLKLRTAVVRRKKHEQTAGMAQSTKAATVAQGDPVAVSTVHELSGMLDEELARLSPKLREVILLNQLEGLSRDEVAVRLGITLAAVKDRLERAREQLRTGLVKRGVTLTGAALAAWLVPGVTHAAEAAALATSTTQIAGAFAAGTISSGSATPAVGLAQAVLHAMGLEKMKLIIASVVTLLTAGGVAYGMLRDEPQRFEKGIRGQVIAVSQGKPSTMTVVLDEFNTPLSLDVAPDVNVRTAFEKGAFSELRQGQYVSVRLADDHRTVVAIHVQGAIRDASIQSITPSGKLIVVDAEAEEGGTPATEVELAPDAILRIGQLPASRGDLTPGMRIPLEFSRDGKLVNAIEAESQPDTVLQGSLIEFDPAAGRLRIGIEVEDDQIVPRDVMIGRDTLIFLDGNTAKLADLKVGAGLTIRVAADGTTIQAIGATSPEPADEP